MIPFADPQTHEDLLLRDCAYVNPRTGATVARIVRGVPRFVKPDEDYGENFGFEWNHWKVLSDRHMASDAKRAEIMGRTHFEEFDLEGRTILECGMGGGDDTEILMSLPFSEIHSFDLSAAVDRAAGYLKDDRLTLSQASIFSIPYRDETFDFVYCHRVLQHTPDPVRALQSIARKVKLGGVLFAHAYKRSPAYMRHYKYKYRWLTSRLPHRYTFWFLDRFGLDLRKMKRTCASSSSRLLNRLGELVPYELQHSYPGMTDTDLREFEKLLTFDHLTPRYDIPMTTDEFRGAIEASGFRVVHLWDPPRSPLLCTAVREL